MSDRHFEELCEKLDILIKLTAMNTLRGRTLTDQVEILSVVGLQSKEIAYILGTDPATVRSLKSRAKRRRVKKTAQGKSKPSVEGGESF